MKKSYLWTLWVVLFELVVIVCFIPGDYTQRIKDNENDLINKHVGEQTQALIQERVEKWHQWVIYDSGVDAAVRNYLFAEDASMDAEYWFGWVDGRLRAIEDFMYLVLTRIALLATWLPFFAIIFIPTAFDGYVSWQIKRTTFNYPSPLLHRLCMVMLILLATGVAVLLCAPLTLEPNYIPVVIVALSATIGLLISNTQKRI